MIREVFLFLSICFFVAPSSAQVATLTVEPTSMEIGGSATLHWQAQNAARAFITGIGEVPTSGSAKVSPEASATYTLLTENDKGIFSKSVKLDVRGAKGGEFPQDQAFMYPVEDRRAAISFLEFAVKLHHVLQDGMKLTVRREEYDCESSRLVFVTNLHQDQSLVGTPEAGKILIRRVAFRVEVFRSPRDVLYIITTTIESKRKIEQTWFADTSETRHRSEADRLRKAIDSM